MPLGRKKLVQDFDKQFFMSFGALAECLHHKVIAVSVHDQRRQMVSLAVHDAPSFGILNHNFPVRGRLFKPSHEKLPIHRHVLAREQTKRDLRLVAIERASLKASTLIGEPHHRSRFAIARAHVAAIDPEMTCADAFNAARADHRFAFGAHFCHELHCCHKCCFVRRGGFSSSGVTRRLRKTRVFF